MTVSARSVRLPCGETHQPGTTCPVCHKYTSYLYVPARRPIRDRSVAPNGTVTVSPANASKGVNVTVAVKFNEGYELGSLAVKDANGESVFRSPTSATASSAL